MSQILPPRSPTWAQDDPKLAPEAPKMGPKGPHARAHIAPKSVFQGPPTSKPKKGDLGSLSNDDFGPFGGPLWAPYGADVGPHEGFKPSYNEKDAKHNMFKHNCKLQVGLAIGESKSGPCWAQIGL